MKLHKNWYITKENVFGPYCPRKSKISNIYRPYKYFIMYESLISNDIYNDLRASDLKISNI